MSKLQVEVVSRSKELFKGEAYQVSAPSAEGYLGILPGRQPLLAVMVPGTVTITESAGGAKKTFEVGPGFISMDKDIVKIVIDKF